MKKRLINLDSIASRISAGFVMAILVATVSSVVCIYNLYKNRNLDEQINSLQVPAIGVTKDFLNLVDEAKKLTNNWIYLPNEAEKKRLIAILNTDYPELLEKVNKLEEIAIKFNREEFVKSHYEDFNNLIISEKKIMEYLPDAESYSNDSLVDLSINTLETSVQEASTVLFEKIEQDLASKNEYLNVIADKKEKSFQMLSLLMLGSIVLIIAVGIIASIQSTNSIVTPLKELKNTLSKLGKGEIAEVQPQLLKRKDEIGEMAQTLKLLVNGLLSKEEFAGKIGQGNYASDFVLLSESDRMGKALLAMRESLKSTNVEEARRNWITTGLANLGEILRNTSLDAALLYDNILTFVVKYINANQGGMFIIEDSNPEDRHLVLVAAYAYERKKFLTKRIEIGEGLIGQCFLERVTMHLTEIPSDYVYITSGVGHATPNTLILVPLKINEDVSGVIEMALFRGLLPHEIDFLERAGESIAATVSSIKINAKTQILLEETTLQAEAMKAQEEEMRQNMEEMAATQEEMERKEQEVQKLLDDAKMNEGIITKASVRHQADLDAANAEIEKLKIRLAKFEGTDDKV